MRTKRAFSLILALITLLSLLAAIPGLKIFADNGENIAKGKPVYVNGEKKATHRVTDGDPDSYWSAVGIPLYAEVDLESNCKIEKVIVRQPLKEGYVRSYQTAFNVYGSTDGVNFDRIGTMEKPEKATDAGFVFEVAGAPEYRVIRVMSTMSTKGSYSSTYISEIEVYGKKTASAVTPTRTSIEFPSYEDWLLANCGVDVSKIKDENGKYRIKDTYTEKDTYEALEGLVCRILGADYVSWFTFEIASPAKNGHDFYEISDADGKIRIKGNEGVSIAAGLNYYLKYFCKVNVSQETKRVRMPEKVVPVGDTVRNETALEVRYTYNYCTLSYTMSYYGYDQWQRELDYLMLSGINVILDTTGTEALWVLYLQNYGYTLQEAIEFVCGYTWKAWWLMGNLEGYGGPVSDNWIVDTVEMARVNQRYMTVMGADPCLQAFVGTLPTDFNVKAAKTLSDQGYDNIAKYMTATGSWVGFLRPYALNTEYNGFDALAKKFYETQNYIYGRIGDYYAGDFLHEVDGGYKLPEQFDKAIMSRTVLDKLIEENDHAVWIIQSWWANPLPEVVKGWGADRENHILLLDLSAVQSPRWSNRTNYGGLEFGGSSWCYCILENYGGRDGAHLNLKTMCRNMVAAQKDAKHMKGIGLTSEATERNPVVFDIFWEQAWRKTAINPATWLDEYAERRYGGSEKSVEAWDALMRSVYSVNTADGTTVNRAVNNYPKFDYSGGYFVASYNKDTFEKALLLLLEDYDACKNEETYVYDLVELFSNKLSDVLSVMLGQMFAAAKNGDYETYHALKTKFLHAMTLLDELTSFEKDQLLGNWVGRVDDWANDPRTAVYSDFDLDLMKLDAVILITNWSMIDLGNYAYRQYNGLLADYYYAMWNNFLTKAEDRLKEGTAITDADKGSTFGVSNTTTYYNIARQVALDIISGKKEYIAQPVPVDGDVLHRSLKELLDEIVRDYFGETEALPTAAQLSENSALTVTDGVLGGALPGNTAGDVAAQFTVTNNGRVVFLDEENAIVPDDQPVAAGMKAVIMEEDGSLYDALGVTVGSIFTAIVGYDTDGCRKTLSEFEEEIAKLHIDAFDARIRGNVASILAAKDSNVYAVLEQAAKNAPAALEEAKAENARVTEAYAARRAALQDELKKLETDADALGEQKTAAVADLLTGAANAVKALGDYADGNAVKNASVLMKKARDAVNYAAAGSSSAGMYTQDVPDEPVTPDPVEPADEPQTPQKPAAKNTNVKTFLIIVAVCLVVAVVIAAAIVVPIVIVSTKRKQA